MIFVWRISSDSPTITSIKESNAPDAVPGPNNAISSIGQPSRICAQVLTKPSEDGFHNLFKSAYNQL